MPGGRATVAVVVLSMMLASAVAALADSDLGSANGLTYIEDNIELAAAPSGNTSEAACPDDTHVTGGGATYSGDGESADVFVNSTRPIDLPEDVDSDPDDGWRNRIVKEGGTTSTSSVTAICVDEPPLYVKESVRVKRGKAADVLARCSAGTRVAGGGGQVTGAILQAHLHTSAPADGGDADSITDDGWRVRAYNASGRAKRVKAYAVCWTRVTEYEASTTASDFQNVPCEGTASASGGGIKIGGPANEARLWISDPYALPENPPDDGYSNGLHSLAGDKGQTGYAICSGHG